MAGINTCSSLLLLPLPYSCSSLYYSLMFRNTLPTGGRCTCQIWRVIHFLTTLRPSIYPYRTVSLVLRALTVRYTDQPSPVTVPWLYGRIPYTVRCEALNPR
ncbi:uncharacterized protein EV420DRAFT_1590323 [Desarmillaria tabescens]|uniref:Secreted protein n=1 Tax=Armillaria tabescens TaxID=1929756 RepID=A0AA39J945_ARMTA|nr:uncharacterized protein EV420DRAFT_1590323 [Desarmillaria tabescens]KAK0436498.1 hypothetical protein EV420DRAFT_1590323 [Desarmillaria tabescens]